MNGTTKLAAALLLPLVAAGVASAANFPTGTHLVKGTLKDWRNKVLTSSAGVTVQAVSSNGTVLASAKVADPTADAEFDINGEQAVDIRIYLGDVAREESIQS